MGDCIFCGEPAGFLRKQHQDCKLRDKEYKLHKEQGESKIVSLVGKIGSEGGDLDQLDTSIEQIRKSNHIDKTTMTMLIVSGWEKAVDIVFDDGILSEEEEMALTKLKQHFFLSKQSLDRKGAYAKVIKGTILRDILYGNLSKRAKIVGNLSFNLQKTEQIVWVFQGVDYEEKTRTRYFGGSQGAGFRVAKGIYYRTGSFRGERVQNQETFHADTGLMGITNKHIYFSGSSKRFRGAYNQIVSFESFSDGIGIQRDSQTASPQSFSTGDGWFAYNLITNLAQM